MKERLSLSSTTLFPQVTRIFGDDHTQFWTRTGRARDNESDASPMATLSPIPISHRASLWPLRRPTLRSLVSNVIVMREISGTNTGKKHKDYLGAIGSQGA
jgi:hypothetical protein